MLGLDVGGTKIAAGVVRSSGKLLSAVRVRTPGSGVRRDLAALFDAAHTAVASARVSWKAISAIGVGVPGAFDPVTETVWAPNLRGWAKVPLKRLLEKSLRKPTFIEGDRNVQALAEAWLGWGSEGHARNLVFLTVGTGIGAGLIIEGRVVSGTRGLAGAAGWLAVSEKWRGEFSRVGCLEAVSAGPAVRRAAEKSMRENPRGLIKALADAQGGKLTGEILSEAAGYGDATARRVWKQIGDNLGRGVANIVSLLNPDVVVLGGGLAGAGSWVLDPLRASARQWGQPLASRHVRIKLSRLGDDAGILGAARYAMLMREE
jgi:glucokinase